MDNDNGSEPYKVEVRKGPPATPVQSERDSEGIAKEASQIKTGDTASTSDLQDPSSDIYALSSPQSANAVLDQGPFAPIQPEPTEPPKPPFRFSWRRTA